MAARRGVHLLLRAVYYLGLTPLGLLLRAAGIDPMRSRAWRPMAEGSNWMVRPHGRSDLRRKS